MCNRIACFGIACVLGVLALVLLAPVGPSAFAQSERKTDALTPVEEFSKQLDGLKKTFTDLNRRIENSAKTIDRQTSAEASSREIEELRDIVGSLLGAVADNGEISHPGAKPLAHPRAKAKGLATAPRAPPAQREVSMARV